MKWSGAAPCGMSLPGWCVDGVAGVGLRSRRREPESGRCRTRCKVCPSAWECQSLREHGAKRTMLARA